MRKNFIQTQQITLVDLNKPENTKVRTYYYILGGIITLTRTRKATIEEMSSAVSSETR